MSKDTLVIQVRDGNGGTREVLSMDEALTELVQERASKVSWAGPEPYTRFILHVDGTWEYRTPESIARSVR